MAPKKNCTAQQACAHMQRRPPQPSPHRMWLRRACHLHLHLQWGVDLCGPSSIEARHRARSCQACPGLAISHHITRPRQGRHARACIMHPCGRGREEGCCSRRRTRAWHMGLADSPLALSRLQGRCSCLPQQQVAWHTHLRCVMTNALAARWGLWVHVDPHRLTKWLRTKCMHRPGACALCR